MAIDTSVPFSDPRLSRRFWAKVHIDESGCWLWTANCHEDGYGTFGSPVAGSGISTLAHRLAYQTLVGAIPDGYQVDHTCHAADVCLDGDDCSHRRCVNPAHLEAVDPMVNVARSAGPAAVNGRKTHCSKGHEFTAANTAFEAGRSGRSRRRCRTCREIKMANYLRRRAAA